MRIEITFKKRGKYEKEQTIRMLTSQSHGLEVVLHKTLESRLLKHGCFMRDVIKVESNGVEYELKDHPLTGLVGVFKK